MGTRKIESGPKTKLASPELKVEALDRPVVKQTEPGPPPKSSNTPLLSGAEKAKRKLSPAELEPVLEGLIGLAGAAAGAKSPAQREAALRTFAKQLDALEAKQLAALPEGQRFRLGIRLGDALHALRADQALPPSLEGTLATKLGAVIPFLAPKPAASSGPGLVNTWGANHESFLHDAVRDPAQTKVLAQVLNANPHPPGMVIDVLASSQRKAQALEKMTRMYAGAEAFGGQAVLNARLEADLARGNIADDLRVGLRERGLGESDIASFFGAMSEVRQAFWVGAAEGDDMQRTNWIHTRIEVLHTLEAAHALKLSREDTMAAMYGSLFSDAFKDAGVYSVATHNRPGAEWIAPLVMGRHLDLSMPENQTLLDRSMRVAHEHQVTPPLFMAGATRVVLSDPKDDDKGKAVVESIAQKLLAPMKQTQSGGELVFSKAEAERLLSAGISGWAVPHESAHLGASLAAIVGDVWQYVSPDGLMKYTHDLRDPDHAVPLFRDPVISMRHLEQAKPLRAAALKEAENPVRMGAAESSLMFSLDQGLSVLGPEGASLVSFMENRREEVLKDLDTRVFPEVERRLRRALGVQPSAPMPDVPYWNQAVSVSGPNPPEVRASIDLVKQTMEAVLADLGNVPLDPFGTRKETKA